MPITFNYSSNPQPIKPGKKYRNNNDGLSLSLMSDPRVVRGNTGNQTPNKISEALLSKSNIEKNVNEHKKSTLNENGTTKHKQNGRPMYSFEVKKYSCDDLDLSLYLTDRNEIKFPAKVVETQTDEFNERPRTPDYIPRKTGIDNSTQVEGGNELFHFDIEVEPILEVIVTKTLEQALFEICAESELEAIRDSIIVLEDEAAMEKQWMEDKEQETIKDFMIKQSEIARATTRSLSILNTTTKIAGLQAMEQLMPSIREDIATDLYRNGEWLDPLRVLVSLNVDELISGFVESGHACHAAQEVLEGMIILYKFIMSCFALNE